MSISEKLIVWYLENKRPLPWRKTADPYKIWISETMLQQTTTTAVIPYYKKFIKRYPNIKSLASSSLNEVNSYWAGLGYYSRAKNLHLAAMQINLLGYFPKSHTELLTLPGLGAYTSRSVSSIAFEESVGVVDGNVIRLLTRLYNLNIEWWKNQGKNQLQTKADKLVKGVSSRNLNQALMELGATICTPKNPSCVLCPLQKNCKALKAKTIETRPLKREKPDSIFIHWLPKVSIVTVNKKRFIQASVNPHAPFLKDKPMPHGEFVVLKSKPKNFKLTHSITKYKIYISPTFINKKQKSIPKSNYFDISEFSKVNPSSMIKKLLNINPSIAR